MEVEDAEEARDLVLVFLVLLLLLLQLAPTAPALAHTSKSWVLIKKLVKLCVRGCVFFACCDGHGLG